MPPKKKLVADANQPKLSWPILQGPAPRLHPTPPAPPASSTLPLASTVKKSRSLAALPKRSVPARRLSTATPSTSLAQLALDSPSTSLAASAPPASAPASTLQFEPSPRKSTVRTPPVTPHKGGVRKRVSFGLGLDIGEEDDVPKAGPSGDGTDVQPTLLFGTFRSSSSASLSSLASSTSGSLSIASPATGGNTFPAVATPPLPTVFAPSSTVSLSRLVLSPTVASDPEVSSDMEVDEFDFDQLDTVLAAYDMASLATVPEGLAETSSDGDAMDLDKDASLGQLADSAPVPPSPVGDAPSSDYGFGDVPMDIFVELADQVERSASLPTPPPAPTHDASAATVALPPAPAPVLTPAAAAPTTTAPVAAPAFDPAPTASLPNLPKLTLEEARQMQREVGARLADEYERARAKTTNAKVIRKKDKPSQIKYESVMPIAGLVEMEMIKWSATRDEQGAIKEATKELDNVWNAWVAEIDDDPEASFTVLAAMAERHSSAIRVAMGKVQRLLFQLKRENRQEPTQLYCPLEPTNLIRGQGRSITFPKELEPRLLLCQNCGRDVRGATKSLVLPSQSGIWLCDPCYSHTSLMRVEATNENLLPHRRDYRRPHSHWQRDDIYVDKLRQADLLEEWRTGSWLLLTEDTRGAVELVKSYCDRGATAEDA